MIIQLAPYHSVIYEKTSLNIYHANKGEGLQRHEHSYSHLTVCHAGKCIIRKDKRQLLMDKYTQPVNLIENEWHEIEALEDGTVFVNVFSDGKY